MGEFLDLAILLLESVGEVGRPGTLYLRKGVVEARQEGWNTRSQCARSSTLPWDITGRDGWTGHPILQPSSLTTYTRWLAPARPRRPSRAPKFSVSEAENRIFQKIGKAGPTGYILVWKLQNTVKTGSHNIYPVSATRRYTQSAPPFRPDFKLSN